MNAAEIQVRVDRLRALFPSSKSDPLYRFLAHLDDLPAYYDLIPRILEQDTDLFQIRLEACRKTWEIPFTMTYVSAGVAKHLTKLYPTIEERRAWIIENLLRPLGA